MVFYSSTRVSDKLLLSGTGGATLDNCHLESAPRCLLCEHRHSCQCDSVTTQSFLMAFFLQSIV